MVERVRDFIPPMLLTTATEVPTHEGWALAVRWDGMRGAVLPQAA